MSTNTDHECPRIQENKPQMNADQRTEESVGMSSRSSAFRRVGSFLSCLLRTSRSSSLPGASDPLRTSVRELRQRRAYYRCCIPALAGFVSRRSIAPDGFSTTRLDDSPEQRLSRERVLGRDEILLVRDCWRPLNPRMSGSSSLPAARSSTCRSVDPPSS